MTLERRAAGASHPVRAMHAVHAVCAVCAVCAARRMERPVDQAGSRSLKRCSLPVSVRGSVARNSIARGYL